MITDIWALLTEMALGPSELKGDAGLFNELTNADTQNTGLDGTEWIVGCLQTTRGAYAAITKDHHHVAHRRSCLVSLRPRRLHQR